MEQWIINPKNSNKVAHPTAPTRWINRDEIQDQINDGRIVLIDYIGSAQEAAELARQQETQSLIDKEEKIKAIETLEQKALRSLIALALEPNNVSERQYLQGYRDEIEQIRSTL